MNLGIVGSEAAKFTSFTQEAARRIIRQLIMQTRAECVVSGHSPLGGIDIWAIQEAEQLGVQTLEYPPRQLSWSGGYKARNLQIAQTSDLVVCITVQQLPEGYTGMRFPGCYHCGTTDHVKSGGCWTVKQAIRLGKPGRVLVIDDDGVEP